MKTFFKSIRCILFCVMLAPLSYANSIGDESPGEIDLLILNLSQSVQNHVLYLQLIDSGDGALHQAIVSGLDSSLFNLSHYLAFTKNKRTVSTVCEMSKNLKDDFITISRKSTDASSVSEQAYKLAMMCISKVVENETSDVKRD